MVQEDSRRAVGLTFAENKDFVLRYIKADFVLLFHDSFFKHSFLLLLLLHRARGVSVGIEFLVAMFTPNLLARGSSRIVFFPILVLES